MTVTVVRLRKKFYSNMAELRQKRNPLSKLCHPALGNKMKKVHNCVSRCFKDGSGSITLYSTQIHVENKKPAEDGWIHLEEELDFKKCTVYMASDLFSVHYFKTMPEETELVPVFLMFHRTKPKYLGNLPYPATYSLPLMDSASWVFKYLREMETSHNEFIDTSLKQMLKGWTEPIKKTLHRTDWMRIINDELERNLKAAHLNFTALQLDPKPLPKGIDTCTIVKTLRKALRKHIVSTNTVLYAIALTDGRKLCHGPVSRYSTRRMYSWLCPKHKHERNEDNVDFMMDSIDMELALQLSRVTSEEREDGSKELHHDLTAIDSLFSSLWNNIVEEDNRIYRSLRWEGHDDLEQRLRVRPSARDVEEERDIQLDISK